MKQSIGLTFFMQQIIWMIHSMNLSIRIVLNSLSYLLL